MLKYGMQTGSVVGQKKEGAQQVLSLTSCMHVGLLLYHGARSC